MPFPNQVPFTETRSFLLTQVGLIFLEPTAHPILRKTPWRRCMCAGEELGGKQVNVCTVGGRTTAHSPAKLEVMRSLPLCAFMQDCLTPKGIRTLIKSMCGSLGAQAWANFDLGLGDLCTTWKRGKAARLGTRQESNLLCLS